MNKFRAVVPGASSYSSQTAEDCVTVTSLSTPSPEIISPQVMTPEMESLSETLMSWYVFSSPVPVRYAAETDQVASSAVMPRPKRVPNRAVGCARRIRGRNTGPRT